MFYKCSIRLTGSGYIYLIFVHGLHPRLCKVGSVNADHSPVVEPSQKQQSLLVKIGTTYVHQIVLSRDPLQRIKPGIAPGLPAEAGEPGVKWLAYSVQPAKAG